MKKAEDGDYREVRLDMDGLSVTVRRAESTLPVNATERIGKVLRELSQQVASRGPGDKTADGITLAIRAIGAELDTWPEVEQ